MSTPSTPAIARCATASVRNASRARSRRQTRAGGDRDHREVDHRVAQARARPRDRHGHDVVVAHVVAELAHHDRDLDGLAVLVARVEVERVRERAEPEDAVARLDVVQRRAGPQRSPTSISTQLPVLLVRTVVREVAPGEVRVEAFVDRHLDELVEHGEVVLAVGVDGEHEIVRRRARRASSRSRSVGERGDVRLRHALVDVVHEELAAVVARASHCSISARVPSVEPSSTTTSSSTSGYSSSSTAATIGSSLYAGTTAIRRGAGAIRRGSDSLTSRRAARGTRRASCAGPRRSVLRRPAELVAGAVAAARCGRGSRRAATARTSPRRRRRARRPSPRAGGSRSASFGLEVVRAVLARPASSASTCAAARSSTYTKRPLLRAVAVDAQRLAAQRAQRGTRRRRGRCACADRTGCRSATRCTGGRTGWRSRAQNISAAIFSTRRGGGRSSRSNSVVSSTTSPCVAAYTHTVLDEDHAARVGAARGFEHARGAERVDRDALGRVGDDVVHVGHRREVEHRRRSP